MVISLLEKLAPKLKDRRLATEKRRSEGNQLVTSLSESIASKLLVAVPPVSDENSRNISQVYSNESVNLDVVTSAREQFFSALNGSNPELVHMIDSISELQDYSMESYDVYRNYVFFLLSAMVVDSSKVSNLDELRVLAISNVRRVPRVNIEAEKAVLNGIYNSDMANYESDRSTLDMGLSQMDHSLSESHPQIAGMMESYLNSWENLLPIHHDHFDELRELTFSVLGAMCLSSEN